MRRLGDELEALLVRLAAKAVPPEMEEVGCSLPDDHRCVGGWHIRPDGGAGTAYTRCPQATAASAKERASAIPGEQTFETFEKARELDAFTAAQLWTDSCLKGESARLALIRREGQEINTGCGKTHLLRAAARELARAGRWVEMVTAQALTGVVRGRALYDQFERGNAEIETKKWSSCEILILDDLGMEETAGPITGGYLAGLLDARGRGPHALASNLSEGEMTSRYGAALVSRLLADAHMPPLTGVDFRRGFTAWPSIPRN